MSPPLRRSGWQSMTKRPPAMSTICRFLLLCFLQDRRIAVLRRQADHAGQGWDLTELDRVDELERVEIDATLSGTFVDTTGCTKDGNKRIRGQRMAGAGLN